MAAVAIMGALCFPADVCGQTGGRAAMDPVRLQQRLVGRMGKKITVTEVDGSSVTGVLASYDQDSVDLITPIASQPLHILDARIAKVGGRNYVRAVLIAGAVILFVILIYAKGGV